MKQKLQLRQQQNLVMTPQLQQSIKMLQLSSLDLAAFVEQELEKNPLLVREDADEEGTGEAASESNSDEKDVVDINAEDAFPDSNQTPLDTEYSDFWEGDSPQAASYSGYDTGGSTQGSDYSDLTALLEQTVSSDKTLREHLLDQLHVDIAEPAAQLIGTYLIDLLDDNGYLSRDLASVAGKLNCSVEEVEAVLTQLQGFDPIGVFARDLSECLALQLRERNRFDPAMEILLQHLDLVARHDYLQLQKLCGVDEEDLEEMCAEIRALNPRPCSDFTTEVAQPVQPDVFIRRGKEGGYSVEVNNEALPKVLINQRYYAEILPKVQDKHEKQYLTDQLGIAKWLIKALDQRAQTILKVTTEIVARQSDFFRYGIRHLKPMTMKEVADEVQLHESTVSRVTTNKYMATPRGLFELKYFFTKALPASAGEGEHSTETVKHLIQELVDAEEPDKILSDEALVEALRLRGVKVARRTVAKYREALHIPSSVQRRREKRQRKAKG